VKFLVDCSTRNEYFVSTYLIATWREAKAICNNFGMKFVALESELEMESFTKLCAKNADLFWSPCFSHDNFTYVSIGGKQVNRSSYVWEESGNPINYTIKWAPDEPQNDEAELSCLGLKKEPDQFLFDDLYCDYGERQFICEKSIESHGCFWFLIAGLILLLAAVALFAVHKYLQANRVTTIMPSYTSFTHRK